MDTRVQQVQVWVNANYEGRHGYELIPENGKTGWSTVYALTKALQIELGIPNPVNSFGPATASAYRSYGELELGNAPTDNKGKRIVRILQGGCYCKGYDPGGFDGNFTEATQQAVIDLQTDAGLPIRDGKVYDYIFRAFLVMDAYKLTANGDPKIQNIQRDLNYHYYQTAGVCPCDGHYQRNTNKALVYGIQTEEGIAPELQTGTVGPSTRSLLPTLGVGNSGTFVKLFQYALYFNGYDVGVFDGIYGNGTKQTVMDFQEFTNLDVDGYAGKQTWLSALISTGDPTRRGTACDCITKITPARAQTLVNEGYETVGRYLVNVEGGLNKKIQPGELQAIFNAGLTVFPIFQKAGREASDFDKSEGRKAAREAHDAAREYGFKRGTTIYFAVDFDALGHQITNAIIPYFEGVNEIMTLLGGYYQIGVYGPRNVGITVSEHGLASTSFVAGMSTGFSGNLGYPLPSNWAFDQISTISIGSGVGYINIDNNIKSGRDEGSSSVKDNPSDNEDCFNQLGKISLRGMQFLGTENGANVYDSNELVTHYYRRYDYDDWMWKGVAGLINQDFVEFVEANPDIPGAFINIIDPVTGETIGIEHLMATLSAELYNQVPIQQLKVTDFGGWAGDLVTVIIDVYNNVDAYNGDWYACAKEYIGTKTKSGHFSFDDLAGDIDALNIGQNLKGNPNKTIYVEFNDYYQGEVHQRFTKFYSNRFGSDEDFLYQQAVEYINGSDEVIVGMRTALVSKYEVPWWTQEQGEQIAEAFRDIVLEAVDNE